MDGANWHPTQGADPAAGVDPNAPAGGDWRAQLQPEARTRIVNNIMETLKKHLPVSGPEGLNELQKIAVQFEEKIYTAATNQSDYLRNITLKMLSMETKSQQPPGNAQVIPNQNPSGPAPGLPPQGSNPAQPSAITFMSQQQARQPNTSTSVQASLSNLGQSLPGIGQTSILQNMSGMPQNTMNNGLAQGASQDIYAAQRQMTGRQQQQQQSRNQLIYQQQQMLLWQQLQQNSPMHPHIQQQMLLWQQLQQNSLMHPHIQQQQSLLQSTQMQSSQQPMMQMSSGLQTGQSIIPQTQPMAMQSATQSASVYSTAQTGHAGAGDWQEEIYQMVKSLKDQYFAELSELYNKISVKLHHVDSMIPPQKPSDQYERMKNFKMMLERTLQVLQINKNNIQPALREKVPTYERQIITILNSQRRKPGNAQVIANQNPSGPAEEDLWTLLGALSLAPNQTMVEHSREV